MNIKQDATARSSEKIGFNDPAELVLQNTHKLPDEVDSENRGNPLRQPSPAQYLQRFLEVVVDAGVVPVLDDVLDVGEQEKHSHPDPRFEEAEFRVAGDCAQRDVVFGPAEHLGDVLAGHGRPLRVGLALLRRPDRVVGEGAVFIGDAAVLEQAQPHAGVARVPDAGVVEAAALEVRIAADQGAGHVGAGVPADEFPENADGFGVGVIARGEGVAPVAGDLAAFHLVLMQVTEGKGGVGVFVHHAGHDVQPVGFQPVVRRKETDELPIRMEAGIGEVLDELKMAGRFDKPKPGVQDFG